MTSVGADTQFGRYRIERQLGQGGSGAVYLAEDTTPHLPRRVALKVLNRDLADDHSFRERFWRESALAIDLDHHPSIVPVYDAGEVDGSLFIAMRYIEGTDLHSALAATGPLQPDRAASVISQVAGALDTAHAAGLVHRDVKPRNILLSPDLDRAYLADFGLTKRVSAESGLTQAGQFLGTFYYAAPEQIEGRPVDARTDEYALGCVLYECLTGSPPYTGDMSTILAAHLTRPAPKPSAARAGLPSALDDVVTRTLEKDPAQRYQSCGDLAAASQLATREAWTIAGAGAPTRDPSETVPRPVETTPPSSSPPTPPAPSTPAPPRRNRWPLVAAGAATLAVVLAIAIAAFFLAGSGGGGTTRGSSTAATTGAARAQTAELHSYLDRVQGILTQSASGRGQLQPLVDKVQACQISPEAARQQIGSIVANRERVLTQLSALPLAPTPEATNAVGSLQQAVGSSVEADGHYQNWINGSAFPCTGGAASAQADPEFAAARQSDAQSTAAKQAFVQAYNPLAASVGLRQWAENEF